MIPRGGRLGRGLWGTRGLLVGCCYHLYPDIIVILCGVGAGCGHCGGALGGGRLGCVLSAGWWLRGRKTWMASLRLPWRTER